MTPWLEEAFAGEASFADYEGQNSRLPKAVSCRRGGIDVIIQFSALSCVALGGTTVEWLSESCTLFVLLARM